VCVGGRGECAADFFKVNIILMGTGLKRDK